jgi:hypothetical protein
MVEETELEGTAALPRAGSGYLSAIVDTLRLVMPDRSSSSLSSLQGGNARGLQATRRNCVFVKGVLNKLLWVLYEVVRLADTAEDPALVCQTMALRLLLASLCLLRHRP